MSHEEVGMRNFELDNVLKIRFGSFSRAVSATLLSMRRGGI